MRKVENDTEPVGTARSQAGNSPEPGRKKVSSFQHLPRGETEVAPQAVFASVPEPDLRSMRYLLSLQAYGAFQRARAAASNEYENSRMYEREQRLHALAEQYPDAFKAMADGTKGRTVADVLRQSAGKTNPNEPVFTVEEWSQIQAMYEQDLREIDVAKELAEAVSDEQRAWALEREALKQRPDIISIP